MELTGLIPFQLRKNREWSYFKIVLREFSTRNQSDSGIWRKEQTRNQNSPFQSRVGLFFYEHNVNKIVIINHENQSLSLRRIYLFRINEMQDSGKLTFLNFLCEAMVICMWFCSQIVRWFVVNRFGPLRVCGN